jgi:flagellar hook-associated protein 2
MAGISLSGLSTGIDTSTLIQQLVAAESSRYNAYNAQKTTISNKLSSINSLESKLSALKSTASDLSTIQKLSGYKVSSSDTDILTATASSSAYEGSHTIKVNRLATADRWVQTAGMEYAEEYVGKGSFVYSYNNQESVITTSATTTLEELVGLVNNDGNNPGVTASLLYYGGTYHMVLNGNDAGSDYGIKINASNTESWKAGTALTTNGDNASLSTKLSDIITKGTMLDGTESFRIQGAKHDGTTVDYTFAFNSSMKVSHLLDAIETAFGGTVSATLDNGVINVTDKTFGTSQMSVTLNYNAGTGGTSFVPPVIAESVRGGSVTDALSNFAADTFTETQQAQDSQIKVDGYPLDTTDGEGNTVENWITRSSNTISDVIPGVTIDLQSIGEASVTTTRDTSALKAKVQKFVDAYNIAAAYIKDNSGYDVATKVAGVLMGDSTISSIREAIRGPLSVTAAGFLQNTDTFTTPTSIGLTFDKDGLLSLDSDRFDEAIAKDYSAVLDLIGADKTGFSDSNYLKFYGDSSLNTAAGTYDVQVEVGIDEITGDKVIKSARIKLTTESTWRTATWKDNIITGDLTMDSAGHPVHPENSLQISVDLNNTGSYSAKIRVKEGFAGVVTSGLTSVLKSTTGSVKIEEKYLQNRIAEMQTRMESEQKRLDVYAQRLKEKFARMEKTLSLLQEQFGGLTKSS